MPHVPRRYAPSTGIPPELLQPPRGPQSPVPVRGTQDEKKAGGRRRVGLGTLSPHTYEPDQGLILRSVFGKEPDVDPHTGQLVHAVPAPAARPAGVPPGGG